jgi:hypothetical protein
MVSEANHLGRTAPTSALFRRDPALRSACRLFHVAALSASEESRLNFANSRG